MSCKDTGSRSIKDTLELIQALQIAAEEREEIVLACDKPFLGCRKRPEGCNTRPIEIFTDDGKPWCMEFHEEGEKKGESKIFRVERVENDACIFRVLIPKGNGKYKSTEDFFTVNLGCICGIKCLPDTFLECLL